MKTTILAARPRAGRLAPLAAVLTLSLTLATMSSCGTDEGPSAPPEPGADPAGGTPAVQVTPEPAGPETAAVDPHAGHDHGATPVVDPSGDIPPGVLPGARQAGGVTVAADGAVSGPTTGPIGRIEVDSRDHDFGEAMEGEILVHTFRLRNVGEGGLTISQAKPTCGCSVGKLAVKGEGEEWTPYVYNQPIPPGSEFELEAQLNTKNKKSIASSRINIFSNDARGVVTLSIKAKVSTYFVCNPAGVPFGDVSVADVVERSFDVTSKRPGPFLLKLDNKQIPQGLSVGLTPVEPLENGRAERWTVAVKLGPGAREGRMGYPINLLSDQAVEGAPTQPDGSETVYTTSVMLSALVKGLVSYSPQYLSFGLIRPGQIASRTLRVENNDPEFELGVPEVRIDEAGMVDQESKWAAYFTNVVRPVGSDGRAIDIEMTLNGLPDTVNGSFQGKLVVETGHPTRPEVSVLFSGVCRGGVGVKTLSTDLRRSDKPGGAPAQAGGER